MADGISDDEFRILIEELNQRLHDAALAGDVVKLREAIDAGADVEAERGTWGSFTRTPLCSVVELHTEKVSDRAEKGRTACVRALLDAGASASAAVVLYEERPTHTAMHYAAYYGFATICRLLLDAGAALNMRDDEDTLPLQYAVIEKRHRTVVLLLSQGATTDGCTAMLEEYSPGYHSRISSAGSFANYQKQQRAKLMAILAPKFSHLLPPELVSHVITFWGHLGWN
jgi:hypothetical protein